MYVTDRYVLKHMARTLLCSRLKLINDEHPSSCQRQIGRGIRKEKGLTYPKSLLYPS
jgi:hypothetical protein